MKEKQAIEVLAENMPEGNVICFSAEWDCEMVQAMAVAIRALEEIQQYQEIGTVDECREAKRFKEYFDELYGTGLDIANWHENGNMEPFDNFYDAAIDWSEEE